VSADTIRRAGLYAGPLLALVCYHFLPQYYSTGPAEWVEFSQAGRATLALMIWMAVWWLTEAVSIEVTALLPIVAFPLFGIAPLSKVLPLGNPY
jgi:sodium-dependent dicarboxylate transporter 2/3/5